MCQLLTWPGPFSDKWPQCSSTGRSSLSKEPASKTTEGAGLCYVSLVLISERNVKLGWLHF